MVYAPDPVKVASDAFFGHNKNSDGTSQSISSSGGGKDSDRPGTWGQTVYDRPVAPNKPTDPQPEKLTDQPTPILPPTPPKATPPKVTPPSVTPPKEAVKPPTSAKPTAPVRGRPSNLHIDSTGRTDNTVRDTRTVTTTPKSPTTVRSDEKLRDNVCKPRPKDNRPKGGGGGKRGFIPWCG